MPGVPVPFGTTSRLGGPIRRSSDHRFLAPPRRISQLGRSFVGARAEPFPRQHVSHGPVGLAHVQDAYDRYQWTLFGGATLLQRPLPLPLRRPRTSRVHVASPRAKRDANGAEPWSRRLPSLCDGRI